MHHRESDIARTPDSCQGPLRQPLCTIYIRARQLRCAKALSARSGHQVEPSAKGGSEVLRFVVRQQVVQRERIDRVRQRRVHLRVQLIQRNDPLRRLDRLGKSRDR